MKQPTLRLAYVRDVINQMPWNLDEIDRQLTSLQEEGVETRVYLDAGRSTPIIHKPVVFGPNSNPTKSEFRFSGGTVQYWEA